MKRLTPTSFVAGAMLALAAFGVHAADEAKPKKELTPQQQRMSDCSKQSKGMNKDEKSTFMSACLKGEAASAPGKKLTPQQQKMSTCNTEAKTSGKQGAERDKFMKECLSAK
ncbi:PsiF family protein [Roseateles sp. MS654]|uniref:PsiF family protein n=1 Tax=Roseateles sp. MS654 TaxID=3412685 RepID=UPI003C2D84EB